MMICHGCHSYVTAVDTNGWCFLAMFEDFPTHEAQKIRRISQLATLVFPCQRVYPIVYLDSIRCSNYFP